MMVSVLIFSVLRAWPILVSYFPNREDLVGSQGDNAIQVDLATRTMSIASGVQLALDVSVVGDTYETCVWLFVVKSV